MLANILSRSWRWVLLRGLLWVAFGIAVFAQPAISLYALTILFGACVLADGVVNTVSAVSGIDEQEHWPLLLLVGLTGIAVGLLTFVNPAVITRALIFYIAIWSVATGLLEVAAAVRLRKEIAGEVLLGLAGLASVLCGVVLLMNPVAGALGMLWLIAGYAVVFGALLIALSFRVHNLDKGITRVLHA
jgi:uncharacterized membrane protein HdeD (DUF308 family)